jgi:type VII secretion ATPase EccA
VVDAKARQYFDSAVDALVRQNFTQADRYLQYATEEWPGQCDLHRALEFSRIQQSGGHTGKGVTKAIRDSLNTFDELVTAASSADVESWFTTNWELPLIPVILPLVTRGQVRAAYAADLVEQGRYDDARDELAAARREKVVRTENSSLTERVIASVECLLYYRTARWEDLITTSTPLTSSVGDGKDDVLFAAVGNAFGGAALAHLNSHDAGQTKLRNAISSNLIAVAAWSSLQLGLSHRTAGDEEAAQKALASGLQYAALPELIEASRNKNITMRISAPDVIAARTSFWDPATEPDMGDFQRQSSMDDRREVLQAAMAELDTIDGMDAIKEQMRTFAAEIKIENEQRRRGMSVKPKTRHLIFKGPPGTGKTTIANLIARLYYGLGVIPSHTLVPANRATLIGAVEGESAKKTKAKLDEARGGVLFVDEAYELLQDRGGQSDPFGSEALTTLLEYIEMWRTELVLIVAGYEAPMERFLAENPGFKSRFAYSLSFNTYTAEEMWRILTGMAAQEGRSIDPSVEERFKQIVEVMWDTDQRGNRVLDVAGNGRFARNVFEQAQGLASRRLFSEDLSGLTDEQLMQLSHADILGAAANILKGFGLANVAAV